MTDRINDATLLLELTGVTASFGDAYFEAQKTDNEKKARQAAFYKAADKALARQRLAQKTITVPNGQEVSDYVRQHHPGWRPIESTPGDDAIKVIIEQDPSQMKYSFTNLDDGRIYQRTFVEKAPQLDDERLREEDPALWEAITQYDPAFVELVQRAMEWVAGGAINLNDLETFLEAHGTLSVKPSSEWTPEQAAEVQKYLVPGGLTMKIVPPRPANDEEIEEAIVELEALEDE